MFSTLPDQYEANVHELADLLAREGAGVFEEEESGEAFERGEIAQGAGCLRAINLEEII